MEIRNATMDDLQAIAAVEAVCFPAAEAATAEEFAGRLAHYAEHFWLLFEQGELVAFVDGFCIDMPDLTDEMYADDELTGSQRWRIRTFRSQRTAQLAFHEPSIKRSDAPRPRRIVVPHRRGCTPGTPEVQSGSATAPSSGKRDARPTDGTGPRNKENPMSP